MIADGSAKGEPTERHQAMFQTWYWRTVARSESVVYSSTLGLGANVYPFFNDSSRWGEGTRAPCAATALHNPLKIRLQCRFEESTQ